MYENAKCPQDNTNQKFVSECVVLTKLFLYQFYLGTGDTWNKTKQYTYVSNILNALWEDLFIHPIQADLIGPNQYDLWQS
jgi:hypothetical protein